MINALDRLHSLVCLSVVALPIVYLVEKHGIKGFLNLVVETAGLIA